MQQAETDILIAGGGMVGAALAVALKNTGLRIEVIEAVPPRSAGQPSYDDRSTALAWTSRRILETMGVWQQLASQAGPIEQVHVSQKGRLGITRLTAAEENLPALGYVVPNRALGQALMEALAGIPSITLTTPAKVMSVEHDADEVFAEIERDGARQRLRARLLVVADGARSSLRESLGIGVRHWDYAQTAIVCNVSTELSHGNTAYERFTREGPMALLPLDAERMTLVLVEANARAAEVLALDDEDFISHVQARFGDRLGRITRTGRRASYPLALITAEQQRAGRALILGNAAHSLHPIAGQGFNLSLRDVAVLAEVIAANADDPGRGGALDEYIAWRRRDQRNVAAFTDILNRLFGIPFETVAHARGLGLLAMDLLPGLRREFSRHAMGRAGRLPKLARGLQP